jgi:hypothetical protein
MVNYSQVLVFAAFLGTQTLRKATLPLVSSHLTPKCRQKSLQISE